MVQRLIDEVYRRQRPDEHAHVRALAAALFALRGGRASEAELMGDARGWYRQHGTEGGRQALERWAAALDVEAGIAEPALRALGDAGTEQAMAEAFARAPVPADVEGDGRAG
jgi:hypothetical protein